MNVLTVLLQAPAGAAGGGSMMWIMLIAMFVIMYFFMIRPQNKKQKEIANFRKSLQVNQSVITAGGDGYLREDNPTGPKVEFTDNKVATYDFSNDLRHFQWGLQAGAGWRAFKHLNIYADLTWGLNNIFKNDFHTITFAMYPIYLNIGFGYAF